MAKAARNAVNETNLESTAPATNEQSIVLDGNSNGKFLLFGIPVADRSLDGPVMRGFLELDNGEQVQVAAWLRKGSESGREFLSLKIANTKPRDENTPADAPDEYTVGPFYGSLFKEVTQRSTRYFGRIEQSVKVGIDEQTHKGIYEPVWELQVYAKPNKSKSDGKQYIGGSFNPKNFKDNEIPF